MSKNKFLNGTLNTIVLAMLREHGRMYGYEICQMTKDRTDSGIVLTEGAIYPTLHKLESDGLVIACREKVNGRWRKYYTINNSSIVDIEDQIDLLSKFTDQLSILLKPSA